MKPLDQWEPWKAMSVAFGAGCGAVMLMAGGITVLLLAIDRCG